VNKLLWLGVIPLAVSACAYQAGYFEVSEWDKVCAAVEAEYDENLCAGLEPPTVIQSKIADILGVLGGFIHDEQYVFVASDSMLSLNDVTYDEVVFHETVHYILWWADYEKGQCESEAAARKITAKQYDKPEDPTWRVNYGCVAPVRGMVGV
jgi:hypothetical protein